jgi:KRAB domain-containing zinc finger protein
MVYEYKKNNDGHYVCSVCSDVKKHQNTMHYHMKKHEGKQTYECKTCDKKFYQKYALDDHTKLNHSKDPISEIECPFEGCMDSFIKKEHCRIHIARNHVKKSLEPLIEKKADSKIHTCIPCKRDFNSYPAILYHAMDHVKEEHSLKDMLKII